MDRTTAISIRGLLENGPAMASCFLAALNRVDLVHCHRNFL